MWVAVHSYASEVTPLLNAWSCTVWCHEVEIAGGMGVWGWLSGCRASLLVPSAGQCRCLFWWCVRVLYEEPLRNSLLRHHVPLVYAAQVTPCGVCVINSIADAGVLLGHTQLAALPLGESIEIMVLSI